MGKRAVRVLVIDDEKAIRELCRRILVKNGFRADCASGGEKGLAMFRASRYDLVISDIHMPGCRVGELMREILRINGKARILLMSGLARLDEVQETLKLGAQGFIAKPFSVKEFLKMVSAA